MTRDRQEFTGFFQTYERSVITAPQLLGTLQNLWGGGNQPAIISRPPPEVLSGSSPQPLVPAMGGMGMGGGGMGGAFLGGMGSPGMGMGMGMPPSNVQQTMGNTGMMPTPISNTVMMPTSSSTTTATSALPPPPRPLFHQAASPNMGPAASMYNNNQQLPSPGTTPGVQYQQRQPPQ